MAKDMFVNGAVNELLQEFCEEYIRLAEMIILFDPEKMQKIDQQENVAIENAFLSKDSYYAYLGENGINAHFDVIRARQIKENIELNSGPKVVCKKIVKHINEHRFECEKIGIVMKHSNSIMPHEIYQNYKTVISQLENLKLLIEGNNYKN